MSKTNYLICSGDACPLRMSCNRYQEWLNNEDDEAPEMEPEYQDDKCWGFVAKQFYGG